jgi:hypothetical protein
MNAQRRFPAGAPQNSERRSISWSVSTSGDKAIETAGSSSATTGVTSWIGQGLAALASGRLPVFSGTSSDESMEDEQYFGHEEGSSLILGDVDRHIVEQTTAAAMRLQELVADDHHYRLHLSLKRRG